jgi:hypothetical protein
MAANFPGWLATVSGAEVLVFISAGGWLARRVIRAGEQTRAELQRLSTYVAVDKVIGPRVQLQLDEAREVITENSAKIAVLAARTEQHDRWHERHDRARD